MSKSLKSEIALVVGTIVAGLEVIPATVTSISPTLRVIIAVIVAAAGAAGIRHNVTPTP